MKLRKTVFYFISVIVLLSMTVGVVLADDSIVFRKNISKTPAGETEKAGMSMMYFYVPAQKADGTLLVDDEESIGIEYIVNSEEEASDDPDEVVLDTELAMTRYFAKPLTSIYIDEVHAEETLLEQIGILSGMSVGEHDTFVAHSLDDGNTWKSVNLSEAADKSSFNLANGMAYPGDVYAAVQATAGNRVMAAWLSRYCDEGSPMYTIASDDKVLNDYGTALQDYYQLPDLYVQDIWGVTGTQKSVDYTLQGFPEVGEIPFGCVWTARGTLLPMDDEDTTDEDTIYDIVWTKPERLTSGRRDANRLEIDARPGGGFVITWQEDPEGLRPGQGLGPGEGWSGAIVNAKTDIWYSYITWDNFGWVDPDGILGGEDGDEGVFEAGIPVEEYILTAEELELSNKPKPTVPMSMPVRLTDNDQCKGTSTTEKPEDLYCYVNFENKIDGEVDLPDTLRTATNDGATLCSSTTDWLNPGGTTLQICTAKDGRVLTGRVGASRPRIGLYPIVRGPSTELDDPLTLFVDESKDTDYYFVMAYEETKAMGQGGADSDKDIDPFDIGKNIWYHSFEMTHPDMVSQGGMLNQPVSIDPEHSDLTPDPLVDETFLTEVDSFGNIIYLTEIARRFSLVAQPFANVGESDTTAFLIYKQGILNQGGPADVFARRIVLPDDFDETVDNPYDYKYVACGDNEWIYDTDYELDPANPLPAENPNYVKGLCGAPAINFSGTNIVTCDTAATPEECADAFPYVTDDEVTSSFPKVTEWSQTAPTTDDPAGNLDDQSWDNPYDVSKGHRGFLDGDFLMVLYAWSPNWKANSVGNDHYNLYVRRSFDGGQTFTTTPSSLGGDGTETCENFYVDNLNRFQTCTSYAAGVFEPSRNVSQLLGNKVTILDPRYTPTGGLKQLVVHDSFDVYDSSLLHENDSETCTTAECVYEDDAIRDPSRFYLIFETGDNTTVTEGEAVPLDLYYSQGFNYGDDYELDLTKSEYNETSEDIEDLDGDGIIKMVWNWVENQREDLSGEAGMTASPGGDFMYTVWNQWREDEHENVFDSDIWFRRFFYNEALEALPVTVIVDAPVSPMFDTDQALDIYVGAMDNDQIGEGPEIVEFEWTIDGVIDPTVTGSHYNAPPRTLSNGWHSFSVRAKDNDGKWSKSVTINLLIVNEIFKVNLPLVVR